MKSLICQISVRQTLLVLSHDIKKYFYSYIFRHTLFCRKFYVENISLCKVDRRRSNNVEETSLVL